MASASSEENENHWPGYVDALTTMTMMLIFVMMILSVAMFSLSENVSRGLVEKIAHAAGVSTNGEGLSTDDLAERVASQLEGKSIGVGQGAGTRANTGEGGATQRMSPALESTGLPGEMRRIESGAGPASFKTDDKVRINASPALLTLAFQPRAATLDEVAQTEMKTYLESEGRMQPDMHFELRAFASAETGALSDARRVAYYRAMAVRTKLIALGVAAARITVQIEDRPTAADAKLVQVFSRPAR